MQLDRELIDVTGDLQRAAIRFPSACRELLPLKRARLRSGSCGCGNQRWLTALLAGQIHSGGRSIRDQRRFAVLAMKENVRIGFDFSRSENFRGFHEEERAGAMPQADRKFAVRSDLQARFEMTSSWSP